MSNLSNIIIDFDQFNQFNSLFKNDTIELLTSSKSSSPSRKYLFKIFKIEHYSSHDQKTILDTFYQISNTKFRFLQTYKRFSFTFMYKAKIKPTFLMKFISSKTLDSVLKSPNLLEKWNIKSILSCIFSVSEAMNYLHNHLVIHGNLCPSNIIIDESNRFYVCDFGLYSIKNLFFNEETIFNKIFKDPSMRNNEPSFKTDVYSFGVLMCQLFLSYSQFEKDKSITSQSNLIEFISNPKKSKYEQIQIPKDFAKLIQICLNSEAFDRPTFKQIIETFKTMKNIKDKEEVISIPNLYNEIIDPNYLLRESIKNDPFSLMKAGDIYFKGLGTKVNKQKAMELYKKAADMNEGKAQNVYGVLLQENKDNILDLKKGAKYLKRSAEQGNIHGMFDYGIALLNGEGVEKNTKMALEYIKRSADKGYSLAQSNYGYLTILNNYTPEGIEEGLKYIRKAMNQNESDAFATYAYFLKDGDLYEQNKELAMEFFKIAADLGHEDAAIEYGDGNKEGNGVPKNIEIALKYYQMAAGRGCQLGNERIEKLKNDYTNLSKDPPKKQKNLSNKRKKIRNCIHKSNDQSIIVENPFEIVYPYKISDKITLISLGEIVYDRPGYHNKKFIYPVGYQIEREYFSIDDPRKQAVYRATILDGGENPIFRVECLDKSKMIFEGKSASKPWYDAYSAVKGSERKVVNHKSSKIGLSGPNLFGFTINKIAYLIEHLPNANKCTNYTFNYLYVQGKDTENESYKKRRGKFQLKEIVINDQEEEDNADVQIIQADELEESTSNQIIFNFNKTAEELILIGNNFKAMNDHSNAFRFYKEAANRGCLEAYLKCTEVAPSLETILEYFELAISNNVNGSFSLLREFIIITVQSKKHIEKHRDFAQLFEKYEDFSDAAYIYNEMRDKINFHICYDYAKESIEKIEDGHQQYIFGLLAQEQNELELAKLLFNKAVENGFKQAKEKIIQIERNPPSSLPATKLSDRQLKILKDDNQFFIEGLNFYEGKNEKPQNYNIAMSYFKEASKEGCPIADFYIGNYYQDQVGAEYLKRSADSGYIEAQNRYAYYLKEGIGVSADLNESMKYYKLAADQGHLESIFEYGRMKFEHKKNEEDYKEWISYLKRSAEEMLPDAIYLYSKAISLINPHDSKKFYQYSILKGSKLALEEQLLNIV